MFKKEIYQQRRKSLRATMNGGLAVIVGNSEVGMNYSGNTYHFRQNSSFVYFFGWQKPGYVGVIDLDEGTDTLYGDDFTIDDIIWMGPQPSVKEQAGAVGAHSAGLDELPKAIGQAIAKGRKVHYLPQYRADNLLLLERLTGIPGGEINAGASVELIKAVVALREIKTEEEIAEIDKACNTGYKMHTTAMKMCRPGILEREIAGAIEGIALMEGNGISFPSIVSMNVEVLHNHYHGNVLKEGRMMIVDAGAETAECYASDFTRTMPVNGKFSQRQKEIYNIVLAANEKATAMARPGLAYREAHLAASTVIADGLKSLGILKGDTAEIVAAGAHALFMPHGLGHQMGLDVHDMEDLGETFVGYDDAVQRSTQFGFKSLRMGKTLRQGHVLTVEPGIYFIPDLVAKWKHEKINTAFLDFGKIEQYLDFGGVRIEDDILITADGCRRLGSARVPVTAEQVEAEMLK